LNITDPEDLYAAVLAERYDRLQLAVGEFQQSILSIHYRLPLPEDMDNPRELPDPALLIRAKYKNIAKMKVGEIFHNWQVLLSILSPTISQDKLNLTSDWISAHDLAREDTTGRAIIHYLCRQLSDLIELNPEKYVATNLVNLIVELVQLVYNTWNTDRLENMMEIKKFLALLEMRQGFINYRVVSTDTDTEIQNSDGTGAITDYITDDEVTPTDEQEEATTISDLVDEGYEMEADEEQLRDFAPEDYQ
jgi:hypothetical protein